jgi:uncharacterized protein
MSHRNDRAMTARYDVAIVGAGMSGLLAAYSLLARQPGVRVLLVDTGLPLDDRERYGMGDWGGYGGAGLFLGGRIYLGPAAIPVLPPVSLPSEARPILEGAAYMERALQVNELFDRMGAHAPVRPSPDERIVAAMERAAEAGLEYVTSYPARFLSIQERGEVLRSLAEELRHAGARFQFGTRVAGVERSGQGYRLQLVPVVGATEPRRAVEARAVLLAPGRYGAEWLVGVVQGLGARVVALPSAFGVRLELPAAAYAPLTDINPDPRLQRTLADDAVIKTYATCPGGIVTAVERYGRLVASGVPLAAAERRPSTTFAVLVQPGVQGAQGIWREGETCAERLNARYPGRLAVQRLADVRAGLPTTADARAANPVAPTNEDAVPGRLDDVYPGAYWRAFEDFMGRIRQLAPGMETGDALAYGPAEERFWYFPTDERMQTDLAGLFVAGDGAGQSQGIVQAAVTGLLAGEGLVDYLAR